MQIKHQRDISPQYGESTANFTTASTLLLIAVAIVPLWGCIDVGFCEIGCGKKPSRVGKCCLYEWPSVSTGIPPLNRYIRVVAHSLATPGNCNCVCVLYLCISQFFSCCICYFTLCGLAVSGQVVEAPAGRKQLTAHPNPVLLRRRRGKHTEYLHLWKLQLDVIQERNQDLVQNFIAKV